MPNNRTCFITHAGPGHGTSLYYVTAHWIIRCSGNSAGGRTPTTFIRHRSINYHSPIAGVPPILFATMGYAPREGTHDGNAIVAILGDGGMNAAVVPAAWVAANGVPWTTACAEIDDAMAYARRTQHPRASRTVHTGGTKRPRDFAQD
ncbi:MAG: hypothetical protein GY947_14150 [Rhodobacteraceae bacterium]|nr:hypothetical protein [Paracoccaceae bacterium]